MKHLEYRSYTGSIEYNSEDNLLFGKVLGIKSLISYEGQTGKELELNFEQAIDEYIDYCQKNSIEIERPYKGSFNVRISSELHQHAALLAMESKKSLNSFVAEAIQLMILKTTA